MAEQHNLKIEVLTPTNIEAEVPRQQIIRAPENPSLPDDNGTTRPRHGNVSDGKLTLKQGDTVETFAPVITVKTEETNFGKDGLKYQSVKVTEDVSVNFQHLFKKETKPGKTVVTQIQRYINPYIFKSIATSFDAFFQGEPDWTSPGALLKPNYVGEPVRPPPRRRNQNHGGLEDKNTEEEKKAKTRIPVSRFKTAVDKVQRERKYYKESKEHKNKKQAPEKPPRRSSIPKLSNRILAARKNSYKTDVSDQNDKNKDEEAKMDTSDIKTVKVDKTPLSRQDSNTLRESNGKDIEFIRTEIKEDDKSAGSNDKELTAQANEQLEDEFDKLYDEIVDEEADVISDEILNTNVKDPEKLEIKFEEIVHQYDESVKVEPEDKARYSKIPLLKRRSEQEIRVPKQSERRLSLKTSNDIKKVDKMIHQLPVSDTSNDNDKENKTVETYTHMDRISEINNYDNNNIYGDESVPIVPLEYNIMATPDAELVKVGLSEALQKYDVNLNKKSDDCATAQVETVTVSNSDEPKETKVTQLENNHIDLEEVTDEYINEEPILITENIGPENDNSEMVEITNNSIVSDVINPNNISEDNSASINQDDVVKIATINFDIPLSDATDMKHKQHGINIPNDDEFKSVKLLKNANRIEERTTSRFLNKPLKKQNDANPTKLEADIPIEKGKVSRILSRLTSHENASNYEANNKPDEQRETKKGDLLVKGKVSKILNRITSHDIEQSRKKEFNEPEKKSVLSKIAMFERPDTEPVIPKKSAVKYSKPQRTTSEEIKHSPKIVHEVLKPSIKDGQTDIPFEVVTIDILKPVEVITSEEQISVVKDLKEQSIVYENLDNTKHGYNLDDNEPSEQETTADNNVTVSNDNDVIKQEPSVEAEEKKPIADHNKSTSNLEATGNRFNSVVPKVEHRNRREATSHYVPVKEKINKLQSHEESNMKRAKSTAEMDLGDFIKGKVKNMIYRMNSLELLDDNVHIKQKETISVREKPRKRSVSEKMALLKRKLTPVTMEKVQTRALDVDIKPVDSDNDIADPEFDAKVEELLNARATYGVANTTTLELADGSQMPALALGTALLEPRLAKYIVAAAIDLGFRAIDTAFIYGNEKEVGEGIRSKIQDGTVKREELFIMSKLWSTYHQPELVESACRASLRALGLDYFDLFMIHNPMSFKEGGDPLPLIANVLQFSEYEYMDAWFAMERLPTALARRLGVSNFNSTQLAHVLRRGRARPVVNQVECHPYLSQRNLSSFCKARGIRLSCFGTLGSKGTPAALRDAADAAIDDPLVQVMAAGLGVSPAQLLVSYQLQSGHAVVVKGSTAAHLWDVLQAPRVALTPAQLDALHALNRNRRTFAFKGMGDTHKNYPFRGAF